MNVLAIMGSPNKKGNTYELTRKLEDSMKKLGEVEFEYVFLKDINLKTCRGCGVCFEKGEKFCPLKDDRPMLEEKMHNADGVIFTSPNYVFNVSGIIKNFIDSRRKIEDFSGLKNQRFLKDSLMSVIALAFLKVQWS
ncbi:NAD(P)H-dependent oxidoreductase [Methanobacterium sp.]|uniref:NAD(P)H-dependent oxidoreductase n=1 Tax=Methanobacterium sp. TaxID=2164 RepID=UPI003C7432DC